MKKILFLMDSLGAGGAEKSLISLFHTLPPQKYDISLLLIRESGLFLSQLPPNIKLLSGIYPYQLLGISPKNIQLYLKHGISFWAKKIIRYQKAKSNKSYSLPQMLWTLWKDDIPELPQHYDVAVSYLEGITNYYAIDKVKAKRKILWIHNEYEKLKYNKTFDSQYFQKADKVITISDLCRKNLITNFPTIPAEKFHVLENITNAKMIKSLSNEKINDPLFENSKGIKLLSIGRLAPQKGYDLALKAAYKLKEKGVAFSWFIIGEGPLRQELEDLRSKLGLENEVFFIGLRQNPYNYIKEAEIIIQSSLFEGKSIAIDEAKILEKPIIATNYNTVSDLIQNDKTGIIVEMTPESLCEGIYKLINNPQMRKKLSDNLNKEKIDNTSEVNKYISIIDN